MSVFLLLVDATYVFGEVCAQLSLLQRIETFETGIPSPPPMGYACPAISPSCPEGLLRRLEKGLLAQEMLYGTLPSVH